MGYSDNAKNGMLDGNPPRQRITHVSLHTADPGTTGANEVTGGGYARVAAPQADWNAAASGAVSLNTDKQFAGPPSGGVTHYGIWDNATFLGGGATSGDNAFNAEGVVLLKAGTAFNLNA